MKSTDRVMKAGNGIKRQIGKLVPQTMKRAGKKEKSYSKSQVASSDLVSNSSEQPAREIFEHLDTMLKSGVEWPDTWLAEVIEGIDRVLSRVKENTESAKLNRKEEPRGGVTKENELGDKIKSVCKKIFDFCENNNKVIVELLRTIGKLHWSATGLLVVASVVEKLDTVKHNRKECLRLLKSMNDLAKIVMELRPLPHKTASTQTTIKESIYTILKGAMSCSKMADRDGERSYQRIAHSGKDREELLDVRREIEELHSTLHLEITLCIFKWQCDFRKEWEGRKCSVSNAEQENEERSNPIQFPSILDYFPATKPENRDLSESSKLTRVPSTTEEQGKMVSQKEAEVKECGEKRRLLRSFPLKRTT